MDLYKEVLKLTNEKGRKFLQFVDGDKKTCSAIYLTIESSWFFVVLDGYFYSINKKNGGASPSHFGPRAHFESVVKHYEIEKIILN